MLLQNKSFLACNGLRQICGASTSVIGIPSNFAGAVGLSARSLLGGNITSKANRFVGEATMYKGDAIPSGYTPTDGAWYPNRTTGGMSSRYLIVGDGEINSTNTILAGGLNGTVNMIGSGYINNLPYMRIADHFIVDVLSLTSLGQVSDTSHIKGVIQFKQSDHIILTGQGTIPDIMLRILAWSKSDLTAEGDLIGDLKLPMILRSDLDGEGTINYASLSKLVQLLSGMTGQGTLHPNLKFPSHLNSNLEGEGNIPDVVLKTLAICISTLQGEGEITGTLKLPMMLISHLLGEGNVSYAGLIGLVYLLGNVTGEGYLNLNLRFHAKLSSELSGEGTIQETLLKAIAWCVSDILSEGSADESDLRGKSFMGAHITSEGDVVTPASCAAAVWNSLAAAFNTPATMGKALNSASSAGDPWNSQLENYTDPTTFGAFIQTLLSDASEGELVSIPSVDAPINEQIQFLFQYFRNKRSSTINKEIMFKEDGTTQLGSSDLIDTGTTFTKDEMKNE